MRLKKILITTSLLCLSGSVFAATTINEFPSRITCKQSGSQTICSSYSAQIPNFTTYFKPFGAGSTSSLQYNFTTGMLPYLELSPASSNLMLLYVSGNLPATLQSTQIDVKATVAQYSNDWKDNGSGYYTCKPTTSGDVVTGCPLVMKG